MTIDSKRFKAAAAAFHQLRQEPVASDLKLSHSQETLAKMFRFRNFDGALKALDSPRGRSEAAKEQSQVVRASFWCGLTKKQFSTLCSALLPRRPEAEVGGSDPWIEKSRTLAWSVLGDYLSITDSMASVLDFKKALALDAIIERVKSIQEITSASNLDWPVESLPLKRYVEMGVPGLRLDIDRYFEFKGISEISQDQHDYRTDALLGLLLGPLMTFEDHVKDSEAMDARSLNELCTLLDIKDRALYLRGDNLKLDRCLDTSIRNALDRASLLEAEQPVNRIHFESA